MTNEEAIKRLNKIKAIYKGMDNKSDVKALDMAIKALEQTDGDLISRQAVLDIISDVMPIYSDNYHYILEERIKDLPSAEKTAECDNNHDCEHCDWTECPLEVEKERRKKNDYTCTV